MTWFAVGGWIGFFTVATISNILSAWSIHKDKKYIENAVETNIDLSKEITRGIKTEIAYMDATNDMLKKLRGGER